VARALAAAVVRARIAEALDQKGPEATLGRFTLREEQREQVARIDAALTRFGGALLCDPPGAGKTIVGLAVARLRVAANAALVLAPASLREQWLRSAQLANTPIVFCSLESVSRGAPLPRAPLLIVDEAHRIGNAGTTRHERIASYAARAPVLLLTATPVVNRASDRDRLLSLFLDGRLEFAVDDVVIRRAQESTVLPPVQRLSPLAIGPEVPGLALALRALPPPFPVADGRAATALVRSSLAFAWRSSLAALAQALRRRELNGQALAAELAAGRWPNRRTLKRWIIGDEPTQLTLSLGVESVDDTPPTSALRVIEQHLDAVRAVRGEIGAYVERDTQQRASALLALLHAHSPARTVCFAHHADTVRALWTVLRRTPGVVAITGDRVHAAAGRWSREDVLLTLGPHSEPWRPDDVRGIRLLLTTDLLAEGVELPGAEIVVHGDGAWTPARLEQRVGRARRPSSRAPAILVTGFSAPAGSASLLHLAARLRVKRSARRAALSDADAREALRAETARWRGNAPIPAPTDTQTPPTATVVHHRHAFLALLASSDNHQLVAGWALHRRWRISTDAKHLLELASVSANRDVETDPEFAKNVERVLVRWLSRNAARKSVGLVRNESSSTIRRLRRRLELGIEQSALAERNGLAERVQCVLSAISRAWTDRADRELRTLLKQGLGGPELLDATEHAAREWIGRKQNEPRTSARLVALLLFQPETDPTAAAPPPTPAAPAPPSASP